MPENKDIDWGEQIGSNILGGFTIGTIFGASRYYWSLGPVHNAEVKPILLADGANLVAKYAVKCSLVATIFSVGSAITSGLRNKQDSYNYLAGGALTGIYASFNSPNRRVHTMVIKALVFGTIGCMTNFAATQMQDKPKTDRWDRINEMKNKFSNSPGPEVERGLKGTLIMTYPELEAKSD